MAIPPEISMTPVSSSNVDSVGYDAVNRTIYIRFKNGGEYGYPNQEPGRFRALLNAPSKGQFVWRVLRGSGRDDAPYFRA